MLVLLVAVYATIEFRGIFERGTEYRQLIKDAHFLLGLSVFVLVWIRLIARWVNDTPEREYYSAMQQFTAKAVYLFLYLFMIAMPLLGWSIVSAEGQHV